MRLPDKTIDPASLNQQDARSADALTGVQPEVSELLTTLQTNAGGGASSTHHPLPGPANRAHQATVGPLEVEERQVTIFV